MKRLFPILIFILAGLTTFAQNVVEIQQRNGNVATFGFETKPEITYSGDNLVMNTTQTSVSYPLDNLLKMSFSLTLTGIAETTVTTDNGQQAVSFRFRHGNIEVSGAAPGEALSVYDLQGHTEFTIHADNAGHATLEVSNLPKGVHIVRSSTTSFKFTTHP